MRPDRIGLDDFHTGAGLDYYRRHDHDDRRGVHDSPPHDHNHRWSDG
jgi:hypothetical protein